MFGVFDFLTTIKVWIMTVKNKPRRKKLVKSLVVQSGAGFAEWVAKSSGSKTTCTNADELVHD